MKVALRWVWRFVAAAVLLCLLTLVLLWGATRIYEYRVERLYHRTLRLHVGASTFEDVQQLAKDYQRQVEWRSEVCSPAECKLIIRLRHTTLPMFYFYLHPTIVVGSSQLERHLSPVGTRPAVAVVTVKVTDAKVSYMSFGVAGVSPSGFFIQASFHAAQGLTMFDRCGDSSLGRNSTYMVHSVLYRGFIETAFGIGAAEQVRARATDMRFDCFTTALRDCNDVRKIMPRAYEGYSGELDCDASFARECQKFVNDLEKHAPPWEVDSAFYDEPVSLECWILDRCVQQSR